MLEYFEARNTTRLIDAVEDGRDAGEVRAAQERVDTARTAYLKKLCRGLGADVDPDRFAQLLYLTLIGAEQVVPPIGKRDVRSM